MQAVQERVRRDPALPEVVLPRALPWGRRVLKHPRLMHSNRLVLFVVMTNVLVFGWGLENHWWSVVINVALVAQVNFALGILVRQQFFVNALSRVVMNVPKSWPLRLRWALAKGYHLGGLHVGGAACGTLWFLGLTVVATGEVGLGLLLVYYVQALLLLGIVMTARPGLRAKRHDLFERVRAGKGWSSYADGRVDAIDLAASTAAMAQLRGDPDAGYARLPDGGVPGR